MLNSTRWRYIFYALYAGLALAALSPYLTTGYYNDDSPNSLLVSHLLLRNLTLPAFITQQNHSWMFDSGRLFPLGVWVGYSIWYLIRDLTTYRVMQVGMVLSNLFIFMTLIKALGGTRRLALIAGMIVLSLFQLRNYHDPISSYGPLMQVSMALGTGAVLLFCRFRESAKPALFYGSLALYLSALLYYETALTFLPILSYLAFQPLQSKKPKFPVRWAHLSITLIYLLVIAYLRFGNSLAYNGVRTRIGAKVVTTFWRQLSGGLPMVYAFFGRSGFYTFETLISPQFLTLSALGVLVAGGVLFFLTLTTPRTADSLNDAPDMKPDRRLQILGWSLTLIPAVLVAISEKYQDGIDRPGMAYLPVYLSYFGVALLAASAVIRTRRPKKVATVFALILAFTFSTNQIAADHMNVFWKDSRRLLEVALQQGLLADVEPDARILRATPDSWDWAKPEFMLQYSGKATPATGLDESLRAKPITPLQKTYLLNANARGPGNGRVALARIDRVEWDKDHKKITRALTSNPVKVVDFNAGASKPGWVQRQDLDLLSPAFGVIPIFSSEEPLPQKK